MNAPALANTGSLAAFGLIAALTGLSVLALMPTTPGCTGPASQNPCDYAGDFKTAAAQLRGHSPYFAIEVLDLGSSVYVRQTAPPKSNVLLHTPGALIDKKSCRVCQVDGYATVGDGDGYKVLARYPADKPLIARVGDVGY